MNRLWNAIERILCAFSFLQHFHSLRIQRSTFEVWVPNANNLKSLEIVISSEIAAEFSFFINMLEYHARCIPRDHSQQFA